MTPTEIVRILNENRHDGECDWSHFDLYGQETYWSKNQRLKRHYTYNMSESSAKILARHYSQKAVLAEQDERLQSTLKALPCPFCDGTLLESDYDGADRRFVRCACGARGPTHEDDESAIYEWNQRGTQ